jgi:hypothetical protein
MDSVKLPKGSIILKHNPSIAKNELKVSEMFDGVKLIETSSDNMVKTTDLIIEKMGYTPYNKAFQRYLGANDEEMKLLSSLPQEQFLQEPDTLVGRFDAGYESKKIAINNLVKKYTQKIKDFSCTWSTFCNEQNYYSGLHQGSSWADTEWLLSGLDFISKENKNSWLWQKTNYQIKLLKKLNIIKYKLPFNKDLGYDIDELISIIINSKTPAIANKEIIQKLKIKTMTPINIPPVHNTADFSNETMVKLQELRNENCEFALKETLNYIKP